MQPSTSDPRIEQLEAQLARSEQVFERIAHELAGYLRWREGYSVHDLPDAVARLRAQVEPAPGDPQAASVCQWKGCDRPTEGAGGLCAQHRKSR
jgi:hypothetical protein